MSATRRTRRNSGVAATPSRPRGAARIRSRSSFGLGFMPAFSMADSTAKFWLFFCSASVMARLSRLAARFCARPLSCAQSRMDCAPVKYESRRLRNRFGFKERAGVGPVFRSSVTSVSPDQAFKKQINEGSGTPANAGHQPPHLAMRRAPFWSAHACRRSTAALTSGSISSQRLSFRPGFLGRGLNGRYPPSPVPVQGCTSHPGHHAGRLIPKPPGSRLQTRPRAPPSLP